MEKASESDAIIWAKLARIRENKHYIKETTFVCGYRGIGVVQ